MSWSQASEEQCSRGSKVCFMKPPRRILSPETGLRGGGAHAGLLGSGLHNTIGMPKTTALNSLSSDLMNPKN